MSGYDLSALRLVVIDDSVHMLRIVKTILMAMNIQKVHYEQNATEAYGLILSERPDIIITDWEMTPLNGLDFTRKLRHEGGYFSRVPIVLLTGHTEYERVMEAIQAGVSDVLAKPVSIEILYRRLCRIVDLSLPGGDDEDLEESAEYIEID